MDAFPFLDLTTADWRFRDASKRNSAWLPATVPGCVHTDLLHAGKISNPFYGTNELDLQWIEEHDWEYRTTFDVPATILAKGEIDLCADGLDTVATVFLNGKKIAATENMFTAHRWPVKVQLRARRNELRIVFRSALDYIRNTRTDSNPPREMNDPVGCSVRIRKQQCQFGWDWGPRFVTVGIWRALRIEAWSANRLDDLRLAQTHHPDGSVALVATPRLARPKSKTHYALSVTLDGNAIAEVESAEASDLKCTLADPLLWWPAGQGDQPLYTVTLSTRDDSGNDLGAITKRIGLRTIVLDQPADARGHKFQFLVNGRPIFMKGANWIPAHSFVADLTRADYSRDLRAAVSTHMNTIRVWGGGIYESEDFYDLCDELGLLVWQDFMFACNLYPADEAFLANVRAEAAHQVSRLRHRACLALWCGNNELVQINGAELRDNPASRTGYEKLFHDLLPTVVASEDGVTPYWPSSEWRGTFENGHALGETSGDTHFWDVWHSRHPIKDYEKWDFRFCSEFGMQSYSSPATNATFCPPGHDNVFGPEMENHQKNRAGNQIILDYVSRRYRFPKDQSALITLSQLNQAYCMKVGVEHYRRLMPHCMGALYWQLNDCWPVASWSSIEFTGRWKALHHEARRFFAPALASAHVPGDEAPIVGNYRRSTVREVHLHTVYDAPEPAKGVLRWDLFHLDGRILLCGKKFVNLRPGESILQRTLDLFKPLATHGRDHLYLRYALDVADVTVSEDTALLAPPRFLDLPRAKVRTTAKRLAPDRVQLTFTSSAFQHRFHFDLVGVEHQASDNFFDLHPREPKSVVVLLGRPAASAALLKTLTTASLADTFE